MQITNRDILLQAKDDQEFVYAQPVIVYMLIIPQMHETTAALPEDAFFTGVIDANSRFN